MTTSEGAAVNGALAAMDPDGDSIALSVVTQPAQGVVIRAGVSTGTFTYTPNAGAIGYDKFAFNAQDASGATTVGTQMVFIVASAPRWPGQTTRIASSLSGGEPNGATDQTSISADGRLIAFRSTASNLVPGDSGSSSDAFLLDRLSGTIERVMATGAVNSIVIAADSSGFAVESLSRDIVYTERATSTTTPVTVTIDGLAPNGQTNCPTLSADGRFVAFWSNASNLVPDDTNGTFDVFLRDRELSHTTRVSVASDGSQANGESACPSISADGRFVAFASSATNLDAGDANGRFDVFVHDTVARITERASVSTAGGEGIGTSDAPFISADGRSVAFRSQSSNLVPGDTNNRFDVFVRDRATAQTSRVSIADDGMESNGFSQVSGISADGRYVGFWSDAANLVSGDDNGVGDIFIHDRASAQTRRVHVSSAGAQASLPPTGAATLSSDGRFLSFASSATNLIVSDTNGAVDAFVVGGVAVSPATRSVGAAGAAAAVDVTFAYPGTPWTAVSNVSWIAVTSQSNPSGNGTVSFTVAPNTGAARTGTLTVALQPITVAQEEGTVALAATVTTPNGGERVFANVPTTIQWTSEGTATSFDVELSRNSGGTFAAIAGCADLPGTATSCTWTPTGPNSSTARIRVTARSGSITASDSSDADFTISTSTPSITVTTPNTGVSWVIGATQNIRWNHNLGALARVRVELSRDGGGAWETLVASFQNSGATSSIFPWVVTAPPSSTALVRVTWLDGTSSDTSNVAFSIVRPTVTVTAPNTAVTWSVGSSRAITWTHNMSSGQLVSRNHGSRH